MPDSFEHTPSLTMRMPNGALASLAGNAGPAHTVKVADLILAQHAVAATVERLVREHDPDLVGLSVMTFQRRTALRLIRLMRRIKPGIVVVAGGYDPSLAPDAYDDPASGVDFLVRGEGERTFRELLAALGRNQDPSHVAGVAFRGDGGGFQHAPPRPIMRLEEPDLALPDRGARVLNGYTFLGRPIDVVETSRGCTYDCSFCSIIEMRGRNFHPYPIERVMADIADARRNGAQAIFLVDDNITLDVRRFEELCRAIVKSGFQDADYVVQAMTAPLAEHGATLAPLMKQAGFRYVFLGIENILDADLAFLKARAKNSRREHGRTIGNATLAAIQHLHRHGMYVVGGLIVGNPDDTPESIEVNLSFAREHVDWPYIQHPTPYPSTPMTVEFKRRNLIVDDDVSHYDGTTAVVRSEGVSARDIEFLRWRAERWMKMRHFPAALLHSPGFVLRHGHRMIAHTFTGTTVRSLLGLESARAVFDRFRDQRRKERENMMGPGATAPAPPADLPGLDAYREAG